MRKIRGLSLLQGMSKNFINRLIPLSLLTLAVAACIPITPQPAGIGQPEPTAAELLATPTPIRDSDLILAWQDSQCDAARFSASEISYGKCGETLVSASLADAETSAFLQNFASRYKAFSADTPAGQVIFNGKGQLIPSAAEQRALAYWAQLRFQEARSGRTGAAWGLALSWHTAGGIAGFCEDVAVYLDGDVVATTCRKQPPESFPVYHLSATQLEQVYAWIDGFSSFEYHHKDPAVADAMSVDFVFNGVGTGSASDADVYEINAFVSDLFGQVAQAAQPGAALEAARSTLLAYFDALSGGDYATAVKAFGGSYETLTGWNPDVNGADLVTLWRRGCTQNGLQCLPVRAIVATRRLPDDSYKFTVEFTYTDGALFKQGPCCGDTGPSISTFDYTVTRSGNSWKVMELPPYVP
jgi:hypothetical protein